MFLYLVKMTDVFQSDHDYADSSSLKTEATPAELQWLIPWESHHWEGEGRNLDM